MGKISDVLDKIDTLEELETFLEDAEKPTVSVEETSPQPYSPPIQSKMVVKQNQASGKWNERLFKAVNDDTVIPEVFKTLRSKILHPLDGRPVPKTIMVASSIPREGKTFVTSNLGVSFASGMDQHCLLVDCDLRHPTLGPMFGIKNTLGLADHLRDEVDIGTLISKTSVQKLSVLPAGHAPLNPAELLSSSRMQKFIEEISSRYDDRIIIIDSPPMLMTAESIVLSGHVDGVILVIRQGKARKNEVQKCIDSVDESKILGIVFNGHTANYSDEKIVQGYGY